MPFTNDAIVFGILMISLGFVFYTESNKDGFWHKFYKVIPGLLMCYFIPAIFNSLGVISSEESQTYYIASRYLLPAALLLMTLSIGYTTTTIQNYIVTIHLLTLQLIHILNQVEILMCYFIVHQVNEETGEPQHSQVPLHMTHKMRINLVRLFL